jgi:hypothetical protein
MFVSVAASRAIEANHSSVRGKIDSLAEMHVSITCHVVSDPRKVDMDVFVVGILDYQKAETRGLQYTA